MQVSCGVYSKVPTQGALWAITTGLGRSAPVTGRTERMPGRGGALDAGSCAYVAVDTAKILSILGDRVHEGQKCDPHCKGVWRAAAQLCGAELLGTGLLGVNGG